jgi:hypothetical protein
MFSFINTNKFSIILVNILAKGFFKNPIPKWDGVSMRKNYYYVPWG